jgi:hypothetical protein
MTRMSQTAPTESDAPSHARAHFPLCEDCRTAEQRLWHVYGQGLCCRARTVADTPRSMQPAAFAAATSGMPEESVQAVRARAAELIRQARNRAGVT